MTAPAAIDVAALSYGELAWAIACSDMPTERSVGTEDALTYAVAGLGRVGLAGLRGRAVKAARLVEAKYHGQGRQTRREASVAHDRLWGGGRRFNRAHCLAGGLWHRLAGRRVVA